MRWSQLATPAGALTTLRLIMAGTLPYALHTSGILPLYLLAVWTDVADGYVARRWGHTTRAGAAYDAWVDKALHVNLGWAIAVSDVVPDWFMLCWFSRELIQLPMHFVLMHRFRVANAPEPKTSNWGRATAITLWLAFVVILGGWPGSTLALGLTLLTAALGAVASLDYARIFFADDLRRISGIVRPTPAHDDGCGAAVVEAQTST